MAPPPGPSKVRPVPIIEVFFMQKTAQSILWGYHYPLWCVHFLFLTAPKRGSFCYSKAWQKSSPWLDVRGIFGNFNNPQSCFVKTAGRFLPTDDVTLTTTTTQVQNSMPFFNSTHAKCQHSNPITGGIFRGCAVSISKNVEVVYRSYFGQLLSWASLTVRVPLWLRSTLANSEL